MDSGFFCLHRKILDSYQFGNPEYLKIWIWLLASANYEPKIVPLTTPNGVVDVLVNRGELLFGRSSAARELKIHESKIYRILKRFENEQAINIKSNNRYSIITICKYEYYNPQKKEVEQQEIKKRTAGEQPVNTPNKYKRIYSNINVRFDEFWNLYDKRVNKQKAEKKWNSLSNQDRELAMEHLPSYIKATADKQYRKDPTTYLNNQSWNDEIITAQPQLKKVNGYAVVDQSSNQDLFKVH
jgi:predicted DNA-binding protein (MmcQ/YjbR family)